jgi:hypothetical protein
MIAVFGWIWSATRAIGAAPNFGLAAAAVHRSAMIATAARPCGAWVGGSGRPIAPSATVALIPPVISITLILTVSIISRRLDEALTMRLRLRG